MANIQWFPGHMAKTERELKESVKLADLVIEVLDARIPASSANPDFEKIFAGRERLTIFNKSDLADPARSDKWRRHFNNQGCEVIFANSLKGDGISRVRSILRKEGAAKIAKQAGRGVISRPVRAIVAGIPNSGKSSLINILAAKAAAVTGDRPGVTRSRQWIKLGEGIELLDTPGVLWPKFISADVALRLAFTGAIRDEVYDKVDVAEKLLAALCKEYLPLVVRRYGEIAVAAAAAAELAAVVAAVPETVAAQAADAESFINGRLHAVSDDNAYPLLTKTGIRRGFLARGGAIDYERAAAVVLDEFRAGKIGRITLEAP